MYIMVKIYMLTSLSYSDTIGQKAWSMPPIDVHGIAHQDNKLALIDLLVLIISMAVLSPDVSPSTVAVVFRWLMYVTERGADQEDSSDSRMGTERADAVHRRGKRIVY